MKELKKVLIVNYLESKKIFPLKEKGNQLLYYSPITENEKTPSFYVHPFKNVFHDFSSGKSGDILDLVQILEKASFQESIKFLETNTFQKSFSFSGNLFRDQKLNKIEISEILDLNDYRLTNYVKSRNVNLFLAKLYLKEIHYHLNGRKFFALGFKNDSEGYELRNGLGFKGKTSNGVTTIEKETNVLNLFEGFFDFLSAMQHFRILEPNHTTIILNTNVNLKLIENKLGAYNKINSFLDNDKSGIQTFNKVASINHNAINQSNILYPDFKDFNDYLMQQSHLT
jgi:hypothetical protein